MNNAAKSLINFFRDVCPELLPKKMRGRFTEIDETNDREALMFGAEKLNYDIEGIDLLRKAEKRENVEHFGASDFLDDNQIKKIKIL